MKKFKIAICFSGTLRLIEYTLNHFDSFFNIIDKNLFVEKFRKYGINDIEFDYFFYVSNRNDIHEANKIWMIQNNFKFKEIVDEELLDVLRSNKRTKKIFVENDFEFLNEKLKIYNIDINHRIYSSLTHSYVHISDSNFRNLHQFYAAECCNILKKNYENENNFTYDMIVKCRTDLYFNNINENNKLLWLEHFYLNNDCFFTHGVPHIREEELCFFDPFFYTSSVTSDKYFLNMTDFILKNPHEVFKPRLIAHAEKIWGLFISKNNIKAEEGKLACKILRTYDPEFKTIL